MVRTFRHCRVEPERLCRLMVRGDELRAYVEALDRPGWGNSVGGRVRRPGASTSCGSDPMFRQCSASESER